MTIHGLASKIMLDFDTAGWHVPDIVPHTRKHDGVMSSLVSIGFSDTFASGGLITLSGLILDGMGGLAQH